MLPLIQYNMTQSPSLGASVEGQQRQKRSKSTCWFLRLQWSRLPAQSLTFGYQHWQIRGQRFFFGHTAERMGQEKRNRTTCHSSHTAKAGETSQRLFIWQDELWQDLRKKDMISEMNCLG